LAPLRNANAHLRDVDEVVRSDAEAAVIWFNAALSRVEKLEEEEPTELPLGEDEAGEVEAVSIDDLEADLRAPQPH